MKKLLKAILLFLFYHFGNSVDGQPVNKLDGIINEFSSVSRFITGIAIHNTLKDNPRSVDNIIAELLNIPSGSLLNQLKVARPDIPGHELAAFVTAVETIPILKTTDVVGLNKGMQLLGEMKQNTTIFEKDKVKDPSDEFQKAFKDTVFGTFSNDIKEKVTNTLKKLKELNDLKGYASYGPGIFKLALVEFQNSLDPIVGGLTQMKTLKTDAAEFFKLINTTNMLKEIHLFAQHSKDYVENIDLLKKMHTQVDNVKSDVSGMEGIKDQPVAVMGQQLGLVMDVFGQLMTSDSIQKAFTSGFLNGYSDILLIQKDTKNSILLKLLSDGKSMDEIVNSLTLLNTFHDTMKKMDISWKEASGNVTILVDYSEVQRILTNASTKVPQLSNVQTAKNALDDVKDCVKDLKEPTQQFEFVQLESLLKGLYDIEKRVKQLDTDIQSLISNPLFDEHFKKAEEWAKAAINHSTSENLTKLEEVFNSFKLYSKFDGVVKLIEKFGEISSNATEIKKNTEVGRKWSLIPSLLNVHDNTGLPNALKCLETAQYNSNDIIQLLTLRKEMDGAKDKVVTMRTVSDHLLKLYTVLSDFKQVQAAVNTTRVKRASSGPKQLKFKDGLKTSNDLGKGVQSLVDLNNIYKSKEKVKKVLTLDASVHQAVRSIEPKWDEARRTQLENTVSGLTKLESFAGKLNKSDFGSLWSTLDESSKIIGVELDSKMFNDPVGVQLENSNDPNVKAAADDFKALSTLNLHFAKHQLNLKAASIAIIPIQTFFDSYFGLDRGLITGKPNGENVAVERSSGEGMSGWMIALLVCGPLGGAILIAIIILLVVRYIRKKKYEKLAAQYGMKKAYRDRKAREARDRVDEHNWDRREHFWDYCTFCDEKDVEESVCAAVKTGNIDQLKKLIKRGKYLNYYSSSNLTPLHYAVYIGHADMVELLIKSGADRTMVNSDRDTPEMMCKWLVKPEHFHMRVDGKEETFNRVEAAKECLEIFEKLRGQEFDHAIPTPMPLKDLSVKFLYEGEERPKFEKKYIQLVEYLSVLDLPKIYPTVQVATRNSPYISHYVVAPIDGALKVCDKEIDNECVEVNGVYPNGALLMRAIFSNSFIVSYEWAKAILKDPANREREREFLVTKVEFDGVIYENFEAIKRMFRGREISMLANSAFFFSGQIPAECKAMEDISKRATDRTLKTANDVADIFPRYFTFFTTFHPYWFPEMKPMFFVHKNNLRHEMEALFSKEQLAQGEVMSIHDFFHFFLSQNYGELKKKVEILYKDEEYMKKWTRNYSQIRPIFRDYPAYQETFDLYWYSRDFRETRWKYNE